MFPAKILPLVSFEPIWLWRSAGELTQTFTLIDNSAPHLFFNDNSYHYKKYFIFHFLASWLHMSYILCEDLLYLITFNSFLQA